MEPQQGQTKHRRRIGACVALLAGIAIAVSLMPLSHTGGIHAAAAETGFPKIRLDTIGNIRKALDWIVGGKKFTVVVPKQNASKLAVEVAQHRAQIKKLASKLRLGDDWLCDTVDYLERANLINQRVQTGEAFDYAQAQAFENGGGFAEAWSLTRALDGLSDNVVRETVSAACQSRI